ncbi:MAG: M1 family metallopeptidase [Flavobacteriales bacterium]|nr:M1 family metallopeptidase [Flavobacteriales bacterium]
MRYLTFLLLVVIFSACEFYRPPRSSNAGQYPEFTLKDTLIGSLGEYRSCFDVKYYELDLEIDPVKKTVGGEVTTHFEVVESTQKMQLDLDDELAILWVKDEQGNELNFQRVEHSFFVDLKNELKPGERSSVTVSYFGKPQKAKKPPWKGGLVWKSEKGSKFSGVACEDDGAHVWWPLKDHISDKPDSVQAAFTVPKALMCVSNGRLMKEEEVGEEKKKYTWRTSYPINTYNVTFYLGNFERFELPYEGKYEEFPIEFYVLEHHLEKAKKHFKQARKILYVFEDLFGPYPWPKDGYRLVESPYAGMEHQSAIAYGNGYKNGKYTGYDYIILHETAHEWWGNAVTCCDMADLWIHEGFATYAEMLYEEKKEASYMYETSYSINRIYSKNKRPIVGPMDVSYKNFRDNDIYNKGAVVLHMLRRTIEHDSTFFSILKRFSMEYREQCVTTPDFIALVNEETGDDYQWFFDQYVYRREAPELWYYSNLEGMRDQTIYYQWNPANTNADFELELRIITDKEEFRIQPSSEVQKIKIPMDKVGYAYLDDEDYVLFTQKKDLKN